MGRRFVVRGLTVAWQNATVMRRERADLAKPPLRVARDLLGDVLVRRLDSGQVLRGRIVETEAYLGPHDLASHTAKGHTKRNSVMFGPAGHAYVYFIYGMHFCVNVVTGRAAAVLIRALEPLTTPEPPPRLDGPGRLTRAFDITLGLNGVDLTQRDSPLFIEAGTRVASRFVVRGPRVGLGQVGEWRDKPYRFRVAKGAGL